MTSPNARAEIETRAFTPTDRDAVQVLAGAHRYPLFHYVGELDRAALGRWTWASVAPVLEATDVAGIVATRAGDVCGVSFVAPRGWESNALGIHAGAIGPLYFDAEALHAPVVADALVGASVAKAMAMDIEHLTVRADTGDLLLVQSLEAHGFQTMDIVLHLGRTPSEPAGEAPSGIVCRLHRPEDVPFLREIARGAFRHDRLHADPAIDPARASEAYATWIENSAKGLDDGVVVATVDGDVAGFVTLKLVAGAEAHLGVKLGKIWLVGVDERMRGKGLLFAMSRFALRWFEEQGVAHVEVGTQLHNRAAIRAYSRAGFGIGNSVFALRKLVQR